MIAEVSTKQALVRAMMENAEEIHVNNDRLALGIMTRPKKFRLALYAMLVKGYRLQAARCLGMFDVRFIREADTA